jgi:hypothetical protein
VAFPAGTDNGVRQQAVHVGDARQARQLQPRLTVLGWC